MNEKLLWMNPVKIAAQAAKEMKFHPKNPSMLTVALPSPYDITKQNLLKHFYCTSTPGSLPHK